jgi:hypothetical protein
MTNERASLIERRSLFSATAQQQRPPGVGKSRIKPGECGRQTGFVEISRNDAY